MITTFRTLFAGANARAEDRLRDVYAIELIDQKIRETEAQVHAAKSTLASLLQRKRSEQKLLDMLRTRIASMMDRARSAMEAGQDALAQEAAQAIAEMENEVTVRQGTIDRLDTQVTRLQSTVEAGHRRVIDLKQGEIAAKAAESEAAIADYRAGAKAAVDEVARDTAAALVSSLGGKAETDAIAAAVTARVIG